MNYQFKIYVLKDPNTGEIRYVGQTMYDLKSRLRKHLNIKDHHTGHKANWLRSLTEEPVIELIDTTDNKEKSDELEKHYIKFFKDNGCKLTNMTDGGDGCFGYKHNESSINKMLGRIMSDVNQKYGQKFCVGIIFSPKVYLSNL